MDDNIADGKRDLTIIHELPRFVWESWKGRKAAAKTCGKQQTLRVGEVATRRRRRQRADNETRHDIWQQSCQRKTIF